MCLYSTKVITSAPETEWFKYYPLPRLFLDIVPLKLKPKGENFYLLFLYESLDLQLHFFFNFLLYFQYSTQKTPYRQLDFCSLGEQKSS